MTMIKTNIKKYYYYLLGLHVFLKAAVDKHLSKFTKLFQLQIATFKRITSQLDF